jgi:hypothetical protein
MAAVRPKATWVGPIRLDLKLIPGVLNNGVAYRNWWTDLTTTPTVIGENGLEITLDGEQPDIYVYCNLKDNTTYTAVFTITKNTLDQPVRTSNFATAIANPSRNIATAGQTGETRTLIDTHNPITNQRLRFRPNAAATGEFDFTCVLYPGDYVTGTPELPATGQIIVGNSFVQATATRELIDADSAQPLSDRWFNTTEDPSNVIFYAYPISASDINGDDQHLVKALWEKQILASGELSGDCLTASKAFVGIS